MMEKVIEFHAKRHRQKIWRDHSDVGFPEGPLGIHAGTQEVLDGTDHHSVGAAGNADRSGRRFGHSTVHLHYILVLCQAQIDGLH